jgi:hypothetical protein
VAPGSLQFGTTHATVFRVLDVGDKFYERIHGDVPNLVRSVLDRLHAVAQLIFRPSVARLARSIDVGQRTPHVVVGDLHCTDASVWHVTIGARDT